MERAIAYFSTWCEVSGEHRHCAMPFNRFGSTTQGYRTAIAGLGCHMERIQCGSFEIGPQPYAVSLLQFCIHYGRIGSKASIQLVQKLEDAGCAPRPRTHCQIAEQQACDRGTDVLCQGHFGIRQPALRSGDDIGTYLLALQKMEGWPSFRSPLSLDGVPHAPAVLWV
jgi:hypothetical protein